MATTTLSLNGTPGKPQTFAAKDPAGGGASVVGTVFRSAIIKCACLLLAVTTPAWGQL
jgi:hypothetical protein